MNKQTLLLPADAMIRISRMSGNIDIDLITPSIYSAQITEIKRILTPTLYNKLIVDYDADTLSGIYETIWRDYVVDMLAYFSVRDYIKIGAYSIDATGISKSADSADYTEIDKLSNTYGSLGHSIEFQFIEYIKTVSIPEYTVGLNNTKGSTGLNIYF